MGGRGRGRQRGCLSVDGRASEQVKFLEGPPLCTGSRFKGLGFTQHLGKWSFWKGGPVGVLPPASSWAPGHGVLGMVAVEAVCLLWHSLLQFLVHSATSLSLAPCCLVTSVPLAIQSLSAPLSWAFFQWFSALTILPFIKPITLLHIKQL